MKNLFFCEVNVLLQERVCVLLPLLTRVRKEKAYVSDLLDLGTGLVKALLVVSDILYF